MKRPEDKDNGLESSETKSVKNNKTNKTNILGPKQTLKIMAFKKIFFHTKSNDKINKKLSKSKGPTLILIFKKVPLKRHRKNIHQIMKRFEDKWKGNTDCKNKKKEQIKISVRFYCL